MKNKFIDIEDAITNQIRLKGILDNLQDAFFEADLQGNISFVNAVGVEMYGFNSTEELIGKPAKSLYSDENERDKLLIELRKTGKIVDWNGIGLRKDGTTFWLSMNVQFIKDDAGQIIGTQGTVRDISWRKQSEEAVRRSEEKFRKAFNTNPDSIAINRLEDGMYLSINKGFTQILDYTEEDVLGKTSLELNIWEDIEVRKRFAQDLRKHGYIENMEARFRAKSGKIVDGLMSASIIELEGVHHIISVTRDITERKKTEKALIRSEKELKKAQEITHIGSWFLDLDTQEVIWTEELYKMYGFDPSLPPPPYTEHSKLFTQESWELLSNSLAQTSEFGIPYELELRTVRADKTNGWMWVRGETVKDSSGKIIGLWGAAQDISQRKLTEEALVVAKEKAEESDRLKSAFLANMSHEIRTPMNGILGFAELLKEPTLTGETQQEYIRIIEKAGARMLNIITDIVDISKIESGQMVVTYSDTNVNEQLDYLGKFFQAEAEKNGLYLSIRNSLTLSEATIRTDREKLYAVLTNLIKNSIKYTEKGSIEIGCQIKNEFLEFYVKDSGIGVPENLQQAIFDRFMQVDSTNKMAKQGTGLGLAISKAYIEMLGGKIWLESELGVGSTFYFNLPL